MFADRSIFFFRTLPLCGSTHAKHSTVILLTTMVHNGRNPYFRTSAVEFSWIRSRLRSSKLEANLLQESSHEIWSIAMFSWTCDIASRVEWLTCHSKIYSKNHGKCHVSAWSNWLCVCKNTRTIEDYPLVWFLFNVLPNLHSEGAKAFHIGHSWKDCSECYEGSTVEHIHVCSLHDWIGCFEYGVSVKRCIVTNARRDITWK